MACGIVQWAYAVAYVWLIAHDQVGVGGAGAAIADCLLALGVGHVAVAAAGSKVGVPSIELVNRSAVSLGSSAGAAAVSKRAVSVDLIDRVQGSGILRVLSLADFDVGIAEAATLSEVGRRSGGLRVVVVEK